MKDSIITTAIHRKRHSFETYLMNVIEAMNVSVPAKTCSQVRRCDRVKCELEAKHLAIPQWTGGTACSFPKESR